LWHSIWWIKTISYSGSFSWLGKWITNDSEIYKIFIKQYF
jgi:hypothetical protein